MDGTDMRPASWMSENAAYQVCLTYSGNYCGSDDDSDGASYVIRDEAELVSDDTYLFQAETPCRRNDL